MLTQLLRISCRLLASWKFSTKYFSIVSVYRIQIYRSFFIGKMQIFIFALVQLNKQTMLCSVL